ncbi:hypothetical protein SLS55_005148 [Diplodia seriata]|uniref:Uncharacterized protein n=1 Tax=Diplodia seriata TaxID=420778 RepID=A0ABR3CFJ3_9PEZI
MAGSRHLISDCPSLPLEQGLAALVPQSTCSSLPVKRTISRPASSLPSVEPESPNPSSWPYFCSVNTSAWLDEKQAVVEIRELDGNESEREVFVESEKSKLASVQVTEEEYDSEFEQDMPPRGLFRRGYFSMIKETAEEREQRKVLNGKQEVEAARREEKRLKKEAQGKVMSKKKKDSTTNSSASGMSR